MLSVLESPVTAAKSRKEANQLIVFERVPAESGREQSARLTDALKA
jgi:hypothetical protein